MVTSRLILSRHIRILSLLLLTMNAAALVLAVPVGVTVPPTNTMPARAIDTGIAPTPAIGAAAAAARTTDVTVADPVQPYGASVLVFPRRVDYTGEKLGYEKPTSYDDLYTNAVSGTGADADADAGAPPTPSVRYTKYPASVHVPLGYNRYKNGYYAYYPYRRAAEVDDDDQAGTPGTDSYSKGERSGYSKQGYLNVYNGRTAEDDDVDEDGDVDNRFRHHGHHHHHHHHHSHPRTPRISGSAPASVGLETAPTPMAATVTAAEAAATPGTPQVATANVDAGLQGVSDQAQAQAEPRATANGAETQYIPLVSGLLDNIPIVGPLVSSVVDGLLGGGGGGGIFGILGGGGGGGGGLVNSVLGGVTSTGLGGLVNGAARAATAATNGALDAATAATNGALDAATAATDGVLGGLGI